MCLNNIVSILNRAYVKKTDDINRLNRARSYTDGESVVVFCILTGNGSRARSKEQLAWFSKETMYPFLVDRNGAIFINRVALVKQVDNRSPQILIFTDFLRIY